MVAGDRGITLDGELELDAGRVGQLALELAQLLLCVGADLLADLDVPTLHLETHGEKNLADGSPSPQVECGEAGISVDARASEERRADVARQEREAPAA